MWEQKRPTIPFTIDLRDNEESTRLFFSVIGPQKYHIGLGMLFGLLALALGLCINPTTFFYGVWAS